MAATPRAKDQTGCMVLLGIPFCLGGLMALGSAVRKAMAPAFQWSDVLLPGFMGIIFIMLGGGLVFASFLGRKKEARRDALRASYPQSPWMWRDDWARGRVESTTRATMMQAWGMAIVWNLISAPVLFFVRPEVWRTERLALLAWLFPAAGIGLLIWALRETLRWEEFGKTWFQMSSVPGALGGELRGAIQVHFPWPPQHGVALKLSCVHRYVTGSGKDRSVNEKILWREEHTILSEQIQAGPAGSTIPVVFPIPVDGVETNVQSPDDSILWVLEAEAKVPGVSYQDIFEVPVFRTKDSPTETPEQASAPPFSSAIEEAPLQQPPHSRIVVRPAVSGGTEFYFPAARNPGAAFWTTIFLLIWTGCIWVQVALKAPIFFPVVFGLFGLLLFIIVLDLWLGTSTVVIGSSLVTVCRGILGLGKRRELPFSQITGIKMPIGMQSGGRSGTPYYNIKFGLLNGKDLTVAESIRDKQEAEWLIAQMAKSIGLKHHPGSP